MISFDLIATFSWSSALESQIPPHFTSLNLSLILHFGHNAYDYIYNFSSCVDLKFHLGIKIGRYTYEKRSNDIIERRHIMEKEKSLADKQQQRLEKAASKDDRNMEEERKHDELLMFIKTVVQAQHNQVPNIKGHLNEIPLLQEKFRVGSLFNSDVLAAHSHCIQCIKCCCYRCSFPVHLHAKNMQLAYLNKYFVLLLTDSVKH